MISLTTLKLIADPTIATSEVHLHPDIITAVRAAFVRSDLAGSRVVIHPFTTVGDEEDIA